MPMAASLAPHEWVVVSRGHGVSNREKSKPSSEEEKSFEEAFRDLENGVRNLEKGNLGLEESLAEYEQAIARLRYCVKQLEQARRRVELLQGVDKEGVAETVPFEDEAMELDEKHASRSRRRSANTSENIKSRRATDID
jgi:exodeoxyribonuclease VII small subunit